jgi:outer membrane protein assembly factor BamB
VRDPAAKPLFRSPVVVVARLLAIVVALVACSEGSVDPAPAAPSDAEIARLEALGYVDFAGAARGGDAAGVGLHDTSRAHAGYSLFTYPALARAELVDEGGRVIRSWQGTVPGKWERALLSGDGHLLVAASEEAVGQPGSARRRVILKLAPDGGQVWRRVLPAHHYVAPRQDGTLATLTRRLRRDDDEARLLDNGIALLDPDGELLDERSVLDMLRARPDVLVPRPRVGAEGTPIPDLLHANYLHWLADPALAARDPFYAEGRVLVTLRNQDAVVLLDWERGEAVWAWGPGELSAPHDASLLADGHLLIFDNRPGEGASRIVELDPLTREIVWQYRAPEPGEFASDTRGTVQRLANGNTLIGESNAGRAFEILPDGEIVWEYWVPHRDERGFRAAFRVRRYEFAELHAVLGPDSASLSEAELERLSTLGYVDYSPERVDPARSGLVAFDPERSQPGYTLYTLRSLRRAELVDWRGARVHAWEQAAPGHWDRAVLVADGGLLVVGSEHDLDAAGEVASSRPFLRRLEPDGAIAWSLALPAHHDVAPGPGDRWSVLTRRLRSLPGIRSDVPVRDDGVALVSGAGTVEEERSLYQMLAADPERFRFADVEPRQLKPAFGDLVDGRPDLAASAARGFVDLLHANAVQWMDRPELAARSPLYAPGNLMVTLRNQDTVAIFDWQARRVVWVWGPGEIHQPHDASLLPDGHFLVFDNRRHRDWSRVVEVDPETRRIVWEYRAPTPEDFYTGTRGSAQRLANGNTLIADSDSGRGFEVTPDGAVVWDFRVPHLDTASRRATVVRMRRYDEGFVSALLARRKAPTASEPIP